MLIIKILKRLYRRHREKIGFSILSLSSIGIGINWYNIYNTIADFKSDEVLIYLKIQILMMVLLIVGFEILIQSYKIEKDYKVNVLDLLVKQTKERISKLPSSNTNEYNDKSNERNE